MATSESKGNLVFDHRTLRLIVGGIAFSFSLVVFLLATTITSSISSSYHTDARDVFVGFLFVIGVLLIAYKGHPHKLAQSNEGIFWRRIRRYWARHEEDFISTIGGLAAIAAAVCPTVCDSCTRDLRSNIHTIAAIILFSTVVYFCLVAFLRSAYSKSAEGKNGEFNFFQIVKYALRKDDGKADKKSKSRIRLYLFCGVGIAIVMLGLVAAEFTILDETRTAYKLTYWAETIALFLFGIAWMTASQYQFIRKIRLVWVLRRRTRRLVEQTA
jgi:hypothetical protein